MGESLAGWVGDHKGPGKALDGFSSKIAHGLIGCGMGAAMGGAEGCTAGAIGALVGETAAELFNGDASKAREFTLELSQITSVAAAALLGQDANTALMTATNAVNNNYLSHTQWAELAKELNQCKSPEACSQVRREYIRISAKQDRDMRQACTDLNSASCLNHVNDALLGSSTQQQLIEKGELPAGYFSQQNDLNAAAREYGRKIAVEEVKAICAADPECVRRGDVAKITALGATAGLLALPTVTSSMAAWVVANPVTAVQLGVIGAETAAAIVSGAVSPGSVAEGWLAIAATSGMKFAGPARAIARIGDETTGAFRRGAEVTKLDEVRALSAEVQGFLTSAHASFKGQALTNAGRATTKHPEYFGFGSTEELRAVYRTSSELNDLARKSVGEILENGVRTTGSGGRYPDGWVTYTLPDGRAASWSLSGEFIGFRGLKNELK